MKMESIFTQPLHLFAEGDFVKLHIRVKGVWVELIKERLDSSFSHIIEPAGIEIEVRKVMNP